MITGQVQTTKTNDWGFTSYKVQGTWYGSDAKGPPRAGEGDTITFDAFNKPGKDGREWPTAKISTLRKVTAETTPAVASKAPFVPAKNDRDTYWADKAKVDAETQPRIVHMAAFERAVLFVDLALRNGAFIKDKAWDKVKQTDKLQVLEAFVNEQTSRIMRESYAAKIPSTEDASVKEIPESEEAAETSEEWN